MLRVTTTYLVAKMIKYMAVNKDIYMKVHGCKYMALRAPPLEAFRKDSKKKNQ